MVVREVSSQQKGKAKYSFGALSYWSLYPLPPEASSVTLALGSPPYIPFLLTLELKLLRRVDRQNYMNSGLPAPVHAGT